MDSRTDVHRLVKPPSAQRGGVGRVLLIAIGAVVLIAGACILAAFLAAPWGVDHVLARYSAAGPERSARVGSVRFNPLTLEVELQSFRLQDERAQFAFSASVVTLKLDFRSIFERRLHFESILVESPNLEFGATEQVLEFDDGLIRSWLPAIRVEQFAVNDGRFTTTADDGALPLQFGEIDVELTGFDGRTGPATTAPGRFRLRATAVRGAKIDVDGFLEAGIARSTGRLRLVGFDLDTLHPSLERPLAVSALSGMVGLNSDYVLTAPLSAPVLELIDGHAQIRDLVLVPVMGFTARADEMNATANVVFAASDDYRPASGRVEIADAKLTLSDARITPRQSLEFADAAILLSVDPGRDGLTIRLGGELVDAGDAMLMARIPADAAAERILSFKGTNLPATMLTSYSVQALGRGVESGRADIDLDSSLNSERVSGALRMVARGLAFSAVSGQATGDNASLDLAAALLANADDVIALNVPFNASTRSVRNAAADALRAHLATLTEAPFDAVASLIGGDVDAVRAVPFVPGEAALGDPALAAIEQLADVLNARPRLGLRVHGGYDSSADRNELARQQIRLHVLLATAGPSAQARPQPVDFNSARAQDVLDEFAGERLPAERVQGIAALYDCAEVIASSCRRAYYAALFDALVESEEITAAALNRLGRFRAQSIGEALTQRGIDASRIEVISGAEVIDNPFGIGLPVDLTVAAPP